MNKGALIVITAVAVALTTATVATLYFDRPTNPALAGGESDRLDRQEEALAQIENVASDLQNQATATTKILSQLNSRLTRIERSNQEALDKLSRDIEAVASNQDQMLYSAESPGDEDSEQTSSVEELRARFAKELEKGAAEPQDETIREKHRDMVNRFYEHGDYDDAARQREAVIGESVAADFDSMDVLAVECRNAICKVDYHPDDTGPGNEIAELELINAITVGLGGQVSFVSEAFDDGTSSLFIEQIQER